MSLLSPLKVQQHGDSGPTVIVLHGGPAAYGSAAPIAQGLTDKFRVLEPWQRPSGNVPLTVAIHVEDLHQLVLSLDNKRPAIVGHSWGAMLALVYAATHPEHCGRVVLVGCGTFSLEARREYEQIRQQRTTEDMQRRLDLMSSETSDPGERMKRKYEIIARVSDYDCFPVEGEEHKDETFDIQGHTETWSDMLRLQSQRIYPSGFADIIAPVLMLHGDYDPHPGPTIRDGLLPFIPHLEYFELPKCGHEPWRERHARDRFFEVLKEWLSREEVGP